jgi:DedD protein
VRSVFYKKGNRRSGGERHPFAFFVVGALVVLAVVFVIGMQVGRVIEKRAAHPAGREEGLASGDSTLKDMASRDDIRHDMSAFAEEASRVPAVAPQTARDALAETERALTFRKTLEGDAAGPVSIAPPAPEERLTAKTAGGGTPGKTFEVQAGAFRDRKAAEAVRGKLAADGIQATVREASGQDGTRLYRVMAGPFPDRDQARRIIRRLKERMQIDAILVAG